jgi:deoxyhypusine monooxygenase
LRSGLFRRKGYPPGAVGPSLKPMKSGSTAPLPATYHEYGSVDPAPPAPIASEAVLEQQLMDTRLPMFERMRAIFTLRNLGTDRAVEAIGRALLEDESALLRHEAAYVLGQVQSPHAIPILEDGLFSDAHVMVRHECAEALGNIMDDRVLDILKRGLDDADVEVRESCVVALDNQHYLRSKEFEAFATDGRSH